MIHKSCSSGTYELLELTERVGGCDGDTVADDDVVRVRDGDTDSVAVRESDVGNVAEGVGEGEGEGLADKEHTRIQTLGVRSSNQTSSEDRDGCVRKLRSTNAAPSDLNSHAEELGQPTRFGTIRPRQLMSCNCLR
jgi:hypothetical protein